MRVSQVEYIPNPQFIGEPHPIAENTAALPAGKIMQSPAIMVAPNKRILLHSFLQSGAGKENRSSRIASPGVCGAD